MLKLWERWHQTRIEIDWGTILKLWWADWQWNVCCVIKVNKLPEAALDLPRNNTCNGNIILDSYGLYVHQRVWIFDQCDGYMIIYAKESSNCGLWPVLWTDLRFQLQNNLRYSYAWGTCLYLPSFQFGLFSSPLFFQNSLITLFQFDTNWDHNKPRGLCNI